MQGYVLLVAFGSLIMDEVFAVREAVISAVCAKEFHRLAGCIQRLAKVTPSEEILLKTGVGHLLSDRHLWGLAGHIVQRRAAALQARWRLQFRQARAHGPLQGQKVPAKPLAGYGSRAFLALVQTFEKKIKTASPGTDAGVCRAVAVKAVIMGFTSPLELPGTTEDDVKDQ